MWYNISMSGMKIILAFIIGWFVAQATKFILILASGKAKSTDFKEKVRLFTKSGGMPSGHTASTLAALTYIGYSAGVDSPLFGIMTCVAFTVIYDAVNVRYAVGEQGKKMNKLIKAVQFDGGPVKVIEGHTVLEVLVGGVIGVLMGYLTFIIAK